MVALLSIADLQMLQLLEGPLGGITNGPATILAPSAAVTPFTIKGFAGQSANLQEWKDSAGSPVARMTAGGALILASTLVAGTVQDVAQTAPFISMSGTAVIITNRTTVANVPFIVKGMAAQSGDLQQWQDSAGVIKHAARVSGQFVMGDGVGLTGNLFVYGGVSGNAFIPLERTSVCDFIIGNAAGFVTFAQTVGAGLKIMTAASQKLGFYGVTPIIQPVAIASPTSDVVGTKAAIDAIRVALTNIGITA